MSRFLSLWLVICVSSFALASSVEVVYVAQGTSIVTYNVDPQTLNYTQVGTISIKPGNNCLGPSADDVTRSLLRRHGAQQVAGALRRLAGAERQEDRRGDDQGAEVKGAVDVEAQQAEAELGAGDPRRARRPSSPRPVRDAADAGAATR